MKGGIFGTWFKELATLVLTQTVQAFLLAIVMGIVISAMSEATSTESGTNYAAGMLAIIALSQFGKIEMLVKNIFGIKSQFGGDMESGRKGFGVGTALAMKGLRAVGDNGKKVLGGAKNNIAARREINTLRQKRGTAALEDAKDEANMLAEQAEDQATQDRISNNNLTANKMALNDVNKAMGYDNGEAGAAIGAAAVGGAVGAATTGAGVGGGVLGLDPGQFSTLLGAITNNTSAIQANHKSPGSEKGTSTDNPVKKRTDEIDEKIAAAEEKKKESGRMMRSGIAETAGAIQGAAIGATVGLGMGDNVADYVMTGAGAGDTAGKAVAAGVHGTHDAIKNAKSTHNDRKESKQKAVVAVNQTIQQVQQVSVNKAIKNAKASGNTLTQEQIKKIGQEAAKNTYEKLKNDYSKGLTGSKGKDGKAYNELTKGKNPINKAKGAMTKGSVNKVMKKGTKGISDISNV